MKFSAFNVSKHMLALLDRHGITVATPVQERIIPAIMEARDVIAQSETGSGKTLSFAIPIIERTNKGDGLAVLILVPTRELALQITGEFEKFSEGKHLRVLPVYGGVSINNQIGKISGTQVVVATPGRLIDLLERKEISLAGIRTLVFDEADRMLDMGFIRDIERIVRHVPRERQTMLFSATISKEVSQLSRKYLRDPLEASFDKGVKPELLHQVYYVTTPEKKLPLFLHLLRHERDLTLVFCNRKHVTAKLARKLTAQGVPAKCLNGNMSQPQREKAIESFRTKEVRVLVATDVAARGLHIEDITHVVNYEIPRDVESYTHRIGRTARAGQKGEAISLVATSDEQSFFKQVLFEHRGSIELKTVDDLALPALKPDAPRQEGRQPRGGGRGGSGGGGEQRGGRERDRRRSEERGSGGQRHSGGRDGRGQERRDDQLRGGRRDEPAERRREEPSPRRNDNQSQRKRDDQRQRSHDDRRQRNPDDRNQRNRDEKRQRGRRHEENRSRNAAKNPPPQEPKPAEGKSWRDRWKKLFKGKQ